MDTPEYVNWFRSTSPYINAHRGKTFVLAVSGAAVAHPNFVNIAQDILLLRSLGIRLLLVHGTKPQVTAYLQDAGIKTRSVEGLRVTDQKALPHVIASTSQVRCHIEALLASGFRQRSQKCNDVCVVGGNFVSAKPLGVHHGVDFEHTGEVRSIEVGGLRRQLEQDNIVLLSPLGYSPSGETFNLGFGDLAAQVAASIEADKLISFAADHEMLTERGELLRELDLNRAQSAISAPDTHIEMQHLLRQSIYACDHRVVRSHIISYENNGALLQELFSRNGSGTLLSRQSFETIRAATIDDINGIIELIAPLEADGTLVMRSREKLEDEINRFTVIEREETVIACAALYAYPQARTGEVACVVTHKDYRGQQRGEKLLEHLAKQARQAQLESVFALTTKAGDWFQEQGFKPASKEALPEERQSLYNMQRNSKVFVRQV